MVDLHTHSTYSDGTMTPAELLREAEKAGLSAVALTDHNAVDGLTEFMEAGKKSSVRTIPGVEFSTEYEGIELHILALFVTPEMYVPITELLEDFRRRKEQSNADLVSALNTIGIAIDYEKIRSSSDGYVNRAVIAAEMTSKGYTASVKEAFKEYLSPEKGYYIPPTRPDAFEVISFIKEMGAVAVLAHPLLNLTESQLRRFLSNAVRYGLDAMETAYPRYSEYEMLLAQVIAEDFGILYSGGSDFHGKNKPDIALGSGCNNLYIPDRVLDTLRQCTSRR